MQQSKDHFSGKTAVEHIIEMHTKKREEKTKVFFLDAMRDTVIVIGALYFLMSTQLVSSEHLFFSMLAFGGCFCFWRAARAALITWSRLEKIHRISYEERCEILANRDQEREELLVLYQAKGFSGPLLDRVVDVIMADHDRFLQVMLQEELGVEVESIDHPLQTAFYAGLGAFSAVVISIGTLFFFTSGISWILLSFVVGAVSSLLAYVEKNSRIKAFVWSAAISASVFQALFFLLSVCR